MNTNKYGMNNCGLLAEADRSMYNKSKDTETNSWIDPERTFLNYNLCSHVQYSRQDIEKRNLEFRKNRKGEPIKTLRKDAVTWGSTILTLPKDYQGEHEAFFKSGYDNLKKMYQLGEEDIISAYVHYDESTPHMHFYFIPHKEHTETVAWDKFMPRTMYQTQHQKLSELMSKDLGCEVKLLKTETEERKVSVSTAELKRQTIEKMDEQIQESEELVRFYNDFNSSVKRQEPKKDLFSKNKEEYVKVPISEVDNLQVINNLQEMVSERVKEANKAKREADAYKSTLMQKELDLTALENDLEAKEFDIERREVEVTRKYQEVSSLKQYKDMYEHTKALVEGSQKEIKELKEDRKGFASMVFYAIKKVFDKILDFLDDQQYAIEKETDTSDMAKFYEVREYDASNGITSTRPLTRKSYLGNYLYGEATEIMDDIGTMIGEETSLNDAFFMDPYIRQECIDYHNDIIDKGLSDADLWKELEREENRDEDWNIGGSAR